MDFCCSLINVDIQLMCGYIWRTKTKDSLWRFIFLAEVCWWIASLILLNFDPELQHYVNIVVWYGSCCADREYTGMIEIQPGCVMGLYFCLSSVPKEYNSSTLLITEWNLLPLLWYGCYGKSWILKTITYGVDIKGLISPWKILRMRGFNRKSHCCVD